MRPIVNKLTPTRGFSAVVHSGLLLLLPVVLLVVRQLGAQFIWVSLALVLLSKWRMLAVRPRFWPALVRANSVDMIVGVSTIIFMQLSNAVYLQAIWALLYGVWLLFLKPASGTLYVSLQAFVGQFVGLMALFLLWPTAPTASLVFLTAIVCSAAARHFFDSFEEPYSKMLAYLWGYFGGALVWVLGHWLMYYGVFSLPVVLLSTIGYGLAALYYFDHHEKLSILLRRQFVFTMLAIVIIIITFSDWGDKVV